MNRFLRSRAARPLAAILTAVLLASAVVLVVRDAGRQHAVAYLSASTGIYEGDEVRILGVPVGGIDRIVPEGDVVRVEFHYDADQRVPADAQAVVVTPSLVTTRYLQLTPRWTGGPELADGDVIPVERTVVPVEWDEIKTQLTDLSTELGPHAGDPDGPVARLLDTGARALEGRGGSINETIGELSAAVGVLSENRDDVFSTVRNLQVFVSALRASDQQIVEFDQRLADVSGMLSDNRRQLGTALGELRSTVGTVGQYVHDNRDRIGTTVDRLGRVTGDLAEQQEALATVLHVAPTPVTGIYNAYHPTSASIGSAVSVANVANPTQLVCSGIAATGVADPERARDACTASAGPLLDLLAMDHPPVEVNPLRREGSEPGPATPGGGG